MPKIPAAALSFSPSVLIDPDRLLAALGVDGERIDVLAVAECASTNTVLAEAEKGIRSGHPEKGGAFSHNLQNNRRTAARAMLCVADRQTAGRGRRGRAWASTVEGSLTFSLGWRFARGHDLAGLSLAVGLALRDGLAACGVHGVALKWPNDLLVERAAGGFAKLGGILIELSSDAAGVAAVIGVGLNLNAPEAPDLGQAVAGIDALAPVPERHRLLGALLTALCAALDDFARRGFAPLRPTWDAAHAFAGRAVTLHRETGAPVPGVVVGVDTDGALRVHTASGETRWLAGDVSLRAAGDGV